MVTLAKRDLCTHFCATRCGLWEGEPADWCRLAVSLRSRLSDLSNLSASISQPSPLWGLPYDTVFLNFTRKTHPAYIYPVPQSPARRRQLDYLAELTAGKEKVLVCGDFNTFGGSKELVDFQRKSQLVSANTGHLPTYPARHPVKELDYIMHSQDLHLKNFRIIRFPGSDHLPLLAEFE